MDIIREKRILFEALASQIEMHDITEVGIAAFMDVAINRFREFITEYTRIEIQNLDDTLAK